MKKFIIFIVIVLGIITTSCTRDRYSYEEMKTFVATGEATVTADSIGIVIDSETIKYPIIQIESFGYYPVLCSDGYVYYYPAIQ